MYELKLHIPLLSLPVVLKLTTSRRTYQDKVCVVYEATSTLINSKIALTDCKLHYYPRVNKTNEAVGGS